MYIQARCQFSERAGDAPTQDERKLLSIPAFHQITSNDSPVLRIDWATVSLFYERQDGHFRPLNGMADLEHESTRI